MDNENSYKQLRESKFNTSQADSMEKSFDINEKAKKKLIIVCLVCTCFMIIEFIGGLLANSIAIMTDAGHLLSDLAGFIISVVALSYSKVKANKTFSYGFHRSEIVGAVLSVFIIWILTCLLLVESITRIFDSHHKIQGGIMLVTSAIGLVFNLIMVAILHSSVFYF
jgi:zinc transporter 2